MLRYSYFIAYDLGYRQALEIFQLVLHSRFMDLTHAMHMITVKDLEQPWFE